MSILMTVTDRAFWAMMLFTTVFTITMVLPLVAVTIVDGLSRVIGLLKEYSAMWHSAAKSIPKEINLGLFLALAANTFFASFAMAISGAWSLVFGDYTFLHFIRTFGTAIFDFFDWYVAFEN